MGLNRLHVSKDTAAVRHAEDPAGLFLNLGNLGCTPLGSSETHLVSLSWDAHLCGNAGVVGAGEPERGTTAHAVEPHHDVLQCHEHGVAHVQAPRHVRWRHGCTCQHTVST